MILEESTITLQNTLLGAAKFKDAKFIVEGTSHENIPMDVEVILNNRTIDNTDHEFPPCLNGIEKPSDAYDTKYPIVIFAVL